MMSVRRTASPRRCSWMSAGSEETLPRASEARALSRKGTKCLYQGRFHAMPADWARTKAAHVRDYSEMELAGLEPATSWTRQSRRLRSLTASLRRLLG